MEYNELTDTLALAKSLMAWGNKHNAVETSGASLDACDAAAKMFRVVADGRGPGRADALFELSLCLSETPESDEMMVEAALMGHADALETVRGSDALQALYVVRRDAYHFDGD